MTFADALAGAQGQNLNALRHLLAAAVIVSHAWPIALGPGVSEPLEHATGVSLGGWAVGGFFFLSGMLIAGSAERKNSRAFWTARARRILPGLGVALLFTLALAMMSGSSAGVVEAVSWFLRAISLVSIEHRLSGAFAANPVPEVVNGPLWSLFHEVTAYGVCWAVVRFGGPLNTLRVFCLLAGALVLSVASDLLPTRVATFAPLLVAFSCGMTVHVFREYLRAGPQVALVALLVASVAPAPMALGLSGFALVALVLSLPALPLRTDASYGLYIYGWPVAQTIVALHPGIGPLALSVLSVAATYPLALASWTFVENPAMRPLQARA